MADPVGRARRIGAPGVEPRRHFVRQHTPAVLAAFADATVDLSDPEVMDGAWR